MTHPPLSPAADRAASSAIHDAARDGDLPLLQRLLREWPEGALAAGDDRQGWLPLHVAARACRAACVRELLRAAPRVAMASGDGGLLPAHLAGDAACLALLLDAAPEAAAYMSATDGTPLMCAVERGDAACVRLLLERAPNTAGLCDEWSGHTAAHVAARRDTRCLRLILRAAPQLAAAEMLSGETPAHCAARHGNLTALRELLLRRAPHTARLADSAGNTPAHAAFLSLGPRAPPARVRQAAACFRLVLERHPEAPLQRNRAGQTPTWLAASCGCAAAVEAALRAQPASAALACEGGLTPLHVAAQAAQRPGGVRCVRLLAEAAPQTALAVDGYDHAPLFWLIDMLEDRGAVEGRAVEATAVEAARELLRVAPAAAALKSEGMPPLRQASLADAPAMVELLLQVTR